MVSLLSASFAATIGFYSFYANEVTHSTSFSAVIATTRDSDLDSLIKVASLGAEPPGIKVIGGKKRFGVLQDTTQRKEPLQVRPHIAFGLASTVTSIVRGRAHT